MTTDQLVVSPNDWNCPVVHSTHLDANIQEFLKPRQHLSFVGESTDGGIYRWSAYFPHKRPVMRNVCPWASYQIRKIAGCACAGNAGNVFPRRRFQRKPLVSDPGMHHGTCVTHVPWCISGSLTCGDGENVPGIPGACAPAILRIWQEAHVIASSWLQQSTIPIPT